MVFLSGGGDTLNGHRGRSEAPTGDFRYGASGTRHPWPRRPTFALGIIKADTTSNRSSVSTYRGVIPENRANRLGLIEAW